MTKNVVIFFMSPYKNVFRSSHYTDVSGAFSADCTQTNETALKYIQWKLAQQGEAIDAAFAFVSEAVAENDFNRFCRQFYNEPYRIRSIDFDERSTIDGSFHSVNIMFDEIKERYGAEADVTIHMDLTGGFRHSTVLMLALLQLLRYEGYKVGLVTYTNFNELRIEPVNELMSMFNLIGGAADFAANGNVAQLKQYLRIDEASIYMQDLLNEMERFSECIKCGSERSVLFESARCLENSLQLYKDYLCEHAEEVSEQEKFFVRLLPAIERDYADIFACDDNLKSIPKLIRWCAQKNMLQQAVTYATELLPVYLVDSGLLKIKQKSIIEACQKSGKLWSNWQVYFLKSYLPSSIEAEEPVDGEATVLDYDLLNRILKNCDKAADIEEKIQGKNEMLCNFLKDIKLFDFKMVCCQKTFLELFKKLPQDSVLRYVIEAAVPSTASSFTGYVEKRMQALKSAEKFFLEALRVLGRERTEKLFMLDAPVKQAVVVTHEMQEDKAEKRAKAFLEMRKQGYIESSFTDEILSEVIINYNNILDYRNTVSHAGNKTQGVVANRTLKEQIFAELQLIEGNIA